MSLALALCACSGAIDDQGYVVRSARRSIAEAGAGGSDSPQPIAGAAGEGGRAADPSTADAATAQPEPPALPERSIFDVEPTCTSGEYWDDGDDGDRRMHPGRACIGCHSQRDEAPRFRIAGTVFPTAHEPDECEGLDGEDDVEAFVVITDATGRELRLEVNEVGNFYADPEADIVMPIRAKVVQGDRERVMFGERMSGDCNSCHTQDGMNGAPGRIVAP